MISAWTVFAPLLKLLAWGTLGLVGFVVVLGIGWRLNELRNSK